ncbi:glycosyl transferase [Nocardioides baekrokdamisoli]|uniref:Glycosyl transferase n=1 Tax=Nocardioides baekrokdamisoli TaxID=1804624 RepID=A0A3G9ICF9_9ACTN|nr:glycosyltransferase [Nocardioides baekrokdamisoli]BBH16052.1 glycosyl transferase [Nocardioides baekrokdamisoli]
MDERRIGDVLLARGLATQEQLAQAALDQERYGGAIGRQLILRQVCSRLDLYSALADLWDAPLVDLIAEPPETELGTAISHRQALDQGWVAWRRTGSQLVVATTVTPTERIASAARSMYGAGSVTFRTTTDWDLWNAVERVHRGTLLFKSQDELAEAQPASSARAGLTGWQSRTPLSLIPLIAIAAAVSPRLTFVVVLTLANFVFGAAILFKTVAAVMAPWQAYRTQRRRLAELRERSRRGLPPVWSPHRDDADLPIFTILMPVYHEANIVTKLLANIGALDYPRSKLDVMLLMEEDDHETIAAARAMNPPDYVRLVVVPPGTPQTKPRACNYGLALARGTYAVIYDAEDRPDPNQLRLAVEAFDRDEFERTYLGSKQKPLACVQGKLYYFNADYNVLTRMFAIEYAHWFEAMLPGMDATGVPLPLGGTSNHFHVDRLLELGAWDPFNVTEDADLGLRASVKGYRVAVIDSGTGEEACSQTPAWIRQRTRWIKGYIVTAAVNTRHPIRFARNTGVMGVIGMVGLIMATPLAFLVYPLCLGFTAATYVGVQFLGLYLPRVVVVTSVTTFLFGNALMIVSAMIAATSRYNWRIGIFAIFSPVYWFLHSTAAWRASFQVLRDPHGWEKTPHGLSEDYESEAHT